MAESWVYLPRTAGEPIGMEWWHFQLADHLQRHDPALRATAERTLAEALANRAAAGKKAPRAFIKVLDQKVREARAADDAAMRMGWAELVYQIGWTRDALEAIGYKDKDLSQIAR